MSGRWLPPHAGQHRCRTPLLVPFYTHEGDRWQCLSQVDGASDRCGQIWVVVRENLGLTWRHESKPGEKPDTWHVFRPVTDEQLEYWLDQELGKAPGPLPPREVVAAIRKHFDIGSRQ
jgi:hypothetical protein